MLTIYHGVFQLRIPLARQVKPRNGLNLTRPIIGFLRPNPLVELSGPVFDLLWREKVYH